eukprot:5022165-Pyramimonas_sp.AAC.1
MLRRNRRRENSQGRAKRKGRCGGSTHHPAPSSSYVADPHLPRPPPSTPRAPARRRRRRRGPAAAAGALPARAACR